MNTFKLTVASPDGNKFCGDIVKLDVRAICALNAECASYNDSLNDVALLNNTAGCSFLYTCYDNVANVCISAARSSEHANAHKLFSTCVVGNLQ